jgi:hypothetical protein
MTYETFKEVDEFISHNVSNDFWIKHRANFVTIPFALWKHQIEIDMRNAHLLDSVSV